MIIPLGGRYLYGFIRTAWTMDLKGLFALPWAIYILVQVGSI